MRLSLVALAALAASVQAFKDTSPFLLFSSSPLPDSLKDASRQQLQLSTEALQNAKEFLKDCPSEIYYIVSQPSVSATELGATTDLKTLSSDSGVKARVTVSEVVGMKGGEGEELVRFIEEKCGATRSEGMKPIAGTGSVVVSKKFPALGSSVEEREEILRDHDSILHSALRKTFSKDAKYTFIYLTTPSTLPASSLSNEKPITYEPDFNNALHMDLKRNLAPPRGNGTLSDQRPLFEQYQFFTPGIFMGLLVGLILLAILSVGISGVSSLKVSYAAFDKESGPPHQKQQQ